MIPVHKGMNKKHDRMKIRRFFGLFFLVVLGAFGAVFIYARFFQPGSTVVQVPVESKVRYVNLPVAPDGQVLDFTKAVGRSIDAVVHVKTKAFREYAVNPLYEFFFGEQPGGEPAPILGFGSGVIISDEGYIVTNNHVIEGSDEILVVLNDRREFDAKLIGTDPTTDIALLKIEGQEWEFWDFGD